MSSATEYFGYLLAQGYGEEQIARFAYFADLGDKGIISQNQAYREALNAGWNGADGSGEKKSFADWMNQANEQGWIDKGLQIFGAMKGGGMFNKDKGQQYTPPPPPPKKSVLPYVLGGIALIGIGIGIYFVVKKK